MTSLFAILIPNVYFMVFPEDLIKKLVNTISLLMVITRMYLRHGKLRLFFISLIIRRKDRELLI